MLTATGRSPNTAGLRIGDSGIKLTRGAIVTDDNFQTNLRGVYAVGDCNGKVMLAHAAMAQGEAAAEHIMGVAAHINNKLVPACIFSSPEIAYVGRTEQQLRADGIKYNVGRFDLAGNARSIIESTGGFVKVLADSKFGEVLGVHIAGPHASEMIAEAAVCMNMEGTVEDIVNTIHAHPTVSEATREAAMSVFGRPIHG
jgi:dihydrolipoamide dehydrogenase